MKDPTESGVRGKVGSEEIPPVDPSSSDRIARLEAENVAMRERIERLEIALDAAEAGTWLWEPAKAVPEWDARMRALYGLREDEEVSNEAFLMRVHPDDRETAEREIEDYEENLNRADTQAFQRLIRIIHPEHGERWISSIGRVERDGDGKIHRLSGVNFDVTDRKRAEDALRQSEEKYRKLHESMMDAFARVDMEGRIIESNPAFQEMLGYTSEELIGLSVNDITPEKWHGIEFRDGMPKVLSEGTTDLYEKEYRRKDGSIFPAELRVFLVRDAAGNPESLWAIVRDISRRKAAEAAIREWNETLERRVGIRTQELLQSESRFRQLADATLEGIAVSENGIILDGNAQFAAMVGYELKELIGRKIVDFVAPESRGLVGEQIRKNSEIPYEFIARHKDGSEFPVMASARMREWQGQLSRVTALRDLTDIKLARAKIADQKKQLHQAMRLALISEISAGIVHQIGQPLTAMGVNLAVVSSRLRSCNIKQCNASELLAGIEADVVGMREVVRRLRALAKPVPGDPDPVPIRDVLMDAVEHMRDEAANQGIALIEDLHEELPDLRVDRVQMAQVILNLLHNAVEATTHQSARDQAIIVAARPHDGNAVEFTVRDHGIGLPPEVLEGLFQPFFSTKPDGMGIGLRLSQTIIHAHGGTIEGFNNPGGPGATFRVMLPPSPPEDYTKE